MISFADQSLLWLLMPFLLGMWSLRRVQKRSLAWLESHVAPRFRRRFSVYTHSSLGRHLTLLTIMGALLIVAGAGPSRQGEAAATAVEGRVLLLVDASSSMYADDVEALFAEREAPKNRLEVARQIALELIANFPGYRFALASYSGSGVVHLPMTDNQALLEDALEVLETHNYYQNTGSSLVAALDVVSHFTDPDSGRLQVVMLGDGELPRDEEFDEGLNASAPQGIAVHAITIGSREGQSRLIYDFRDILAKKENPTVLREYVTRRVDEHLERIARRTGGFFSVAEPGIVFSLAERIRMAAEEGQSVIHEQARKDLTPWLLAPVLLAFLFDALIFGQRRQPSPTFDLQRLGNPSPRQRSANGRQGSAAIVLISALFLVACGDSPRDRAHYENESGIGHDAFRRHESARPHYERSRGYEVEPQIPTHNLARSVAISGDVSEAHDLFQEAMTLDPALAEAYFNDGVTLYTWGQAERDPKNCDLERTRELWVQAAARFASTVSLQKTDKELRSKARANHGFLSEALAEIEQLIANPPEHCFSDSPQAGGAGEEPAGGEDEAESGGGGASGEEQDGEGEEDQSEGGGGGGGEGAQGDEGEEDQSQGGGGSQQDEPENEGGGASGGGSGSSAPGPSGGAAGDLSQQQLTEIRDLIQQISERGREGERFHRRTRPEQFSSESWGDPDSEIWW